MSWCIKKNDEDRELELKESRKKRKNKKKNEEQKRDASEASSHQQNQRIEKDSVVYMDALVFDKEGLLSLIDQMIAERQEYVFQKVLDKRILHE